jgi:energy-coupling factor transporter ATP-binding protein EcfA2
MDENLLRAIHVETALDTAIIDTVNNGQNIILTGNPGDGKTHLLRMLAPQLTALRSKPIVILDASAITNRDLKKKWQVAITSRRPFCAAINEAVLKKLMEEYPDFQDVKLAWRQVEQAIVYDDDATEKSPVVVFDLSHRNILSAEVVNKVIERLTNNPALSRCPQCPADGCDFIHNQRLIKTDRFTSRLQQILNRVARRGYHATLHELMGFFSYLLFARRTCEQLIQQSGSRELALAQLPFIGEGRLFDAIRATFDPASVSHPIWDEVLLNAEGALSDWLPDWTSEANAIEPDKLERFEQRKRAFYFFHLHGDELLKMATNDEIHFAEFLGVSQRDALRLVIQRISRLFGDDSGADTLRIWESHRYNQSSRLILYSASSIKRSDLEAAHPRLRSSMRQAYDLATDHVIIRLKSNKQARLRVDYELFEMLEQAQRGIPMLSLDNDLTRRLWQFMEQLNRGVELREDETRITLLDPTSAERLTVTVDNIEKRYVAVERGN